ncbi:Cys-Gln thioester bond-forming surface protein [Actinokineospora sp. 24-640]
MGKLGRVGAALAATALLVGTAALPAVAEAAKGRLDKDNKVEGVGLNIVGRDGAYQASLLHLDMHGGGHLKVYCVEINVGATDQQDMVEVPWDGYPNANSPFHVNRGKLNWVLHHGFPVKNIAELNKLDLGWSQDGLEQHEAVSATQAAIWHFSDGVELDKDDPSDRDDANQDIWALYEYLTTEAVDQGMQPTPVLEINPETVEGETGELVGPFTVTTNGQITKILGELPEGVQLTDADGNEVKVTDIDDGTKLFLKIPADAEAGNGTFGLTTLSKVDVGRLFVGEDYAKHPAQSLIVAQSAETKVEAMAKGVWSVARTVPPTTTTATTVPTTTTAPVTTAPPTTTSVAPAPVPSDELPNTGASILVPILVGLGLLGAGAGALIYQRRRKSAA